MKPRCSKVLSENVNQIKGYGGLCALWLWIKEPASETQNEMKHLLYNSGLTVCFYINPLKEEVGAAYTTCG